MVSTDGTDQSAPSPVPDVAPGPVVGATSPAGVNDEERNRYGVLLGHAAERGLLSPVEYQARLAELADAESVAELQRIVTELPAFGTTAARPRSAVRSSPTTGSTGTRRADPADLDSALWANLTPARSRRGSGNPWLMLAVVTVVLLVAVVALAVVAAHVAHTHHAASAGLGPVVLSRLRP